MSAAQPATTSMVGEMLQLVGVEELTILLVTALLAWTFYSCKQTGSSKSAESLRHNKSLRAELIGSTIEMKIADTAPDPFQSEISADVDGSDKIFDKDCYKVRNKDLTRTKLCMYFLQDKCSLGSRCNFAHASSEIRHCPNLTKTQLCTNFMEGRCTNQDCTYAHGEAELVKPPSFKKKPCAWFKEGKCRNGVNCNFIHDLSQSVDGMETQQGDVSLTQSVTHETRQSGFQRALREEPAQKSEQMPPSLSVGSGEEPAEMMNRTTRMQRLSREANRVNKKLRKTALIVPSGDPIKDALMDKIKRWRAIRGQVSGSGEMCAWGAFCESQRGRNRDPARYPVDVLQQFVDDHCSSEERCSHSRSAREETHRA